MTQNNIRELIRSILAEAKGWWEDDASEETGDDLVEKLTVGRGIRVTGTLNEAGKTLKLLCRINDKHASQYGNCPFWSVTVYYDGNVDSATLFLIPRCDRHDNLPGPFQFDLGAVFNSDNMFDATVEIIS